VSLTEQMDCNGSDQGSRNPRFS